MSDFNKILNEITDYMYIHDIHADRLKGFKTVIDVGAMGTPFHTFVYEKLMTLPEPERLKALKTLQKARF